MNYQPDARGTVHLGKRILLWAYKLTSRLGNSKNNGWCMLVNGPMRMRPEIIGMMNE